MEKQNLTLSLPKDTIRRAKVQAAKENKSLTKFTQEAIEEKLRKESGYEEARRDWERMISRGFDLGIKGKLKISRDEIHERK